MQPDLYQFLITQLRQQGINSDEAPALLRDLANILASSPGFDSALQAVSSGRYLHWKLLTPANDGIANVTLKVIKWNG